jgi:antitoxin (DNA-binding transcriptional repressor) of toxin-antitoxin stability system
MNTKIAPTKIGMREFVRNLKKIKEATARGEEFEVLDHATTVFHITPPVAKKVKKYTSEDLMNFRIKSKITDASLNVDKYVYGQR